MAVNLEKLNKEQREAVTHLDGPLLIVAGAGTGKTTVITERIAYLIETGKANPEEILAVTFTDKAASEMEERVDRALPFGYHELWISTFHSFAERILKDNGLDIGLPTDFKLLDQTAGWMFLRQNLDEFNLKYYKPLGNPTKFLRALLDHFSKCKDQMIYPEDYLKYADSLKTNLTDLPEGNEQERIKEIADAYHTYQRLLLENNFLDFGDLINYCLKLFKQRPAILEKYRKQFKYILVDEFQDTNKAQYELVKILSQPLNNLTVCADDDQSIYRWRGASTANIMQFKADFKGAKEVFLTKNYRSTQDILDVSYNFIQANNPDRLEFISKIDKKLKSFIEEKGIIEHLHFKTLEQEAMGVVKKIVEIIKQDKEASFNDFAILARANDSVIPFTKALERAGVPYQFLASRGLYQKPIILDVISLLKLLDNYHESSAMYRALNLPFLGIEIEDIMHITREAHKKSQSVYETLSKAFLLKGISEKTVNKINFLLSVISKNSKIAQEKTISEVFLNILTDIGYIKHLTDSEKDEDFDLLNQFYRKIKAFEDSVIEPSLKSFVGQINLELESQEQGKLEIDPEQGPDIVKVMTIHSAKGLEFKYVFVVSMVDKRFPSIERKEAIEVPKEIANEKEPEGDVHLQEERRLFYVAMTRAKKGLFFTSAEDYGGQKKKKVSQFMLDLKIDKKEESSRDFRVSAVTEKARALTTKRKESVVLPEHFSFSQLAAFSKCPYQYKLSFVLKVPSKGKPSFSFGQTIHKTLNEFLRGLFQEKKAKQESLFGFDSNRIHEEIANKENSLDYLLKLYDKNWIDEWYENKKQKQDYLNLGRDILKNFYNNFIKNQPKILRIKEETALELPFTLKIGDYSIFGVVDRVDEVEEGVKIIDYKTGRGKQKLETDDKQQLLIYQIALEEVFGLNVVELSYYYLEEGNLLSFLGSEREKKEFKEKLLAQIETIKNSDFKATPGWQCQYCDYKDICNFACGET